MAQPHPATFGDAIAFPHLHRHPDGTSHVHAHSHDDRHALSFSDRYVHTHSHRNGDAITDRYTLADPIARALYAFSNQPDYRPTDVHTERANAASRAILDAIDARIADCASTGDTPPDRVTVDRDALDALREAVSYAAYDTAIITVARRLINSASC